MAKVMALSLRLSGWFSRLSGGYSEKSSRDPAFPEGATSLAGTAQSGLLAPQPEGCDAYDRPNLWSLPSGDIS